jgi:hypothetical protein
MALGMDSGFVFAAGTREPLSYCDQLTRPTTQENVGMGVFMQRS